MKKIEQKKIMHGYRSFEIIERGRLKVTNSSLLGKNEEVVNLFDLDYKFDRYMQRPLKFIFAAVLFVLPAIPFAIEALNNRDMVPLYVSLIFLVPAAICIQQYFYKKLDVTVYRYRNNGNAALSLWNNLPSISEVEAFTDELSNEIKSLRINPDLDKGQKLEIYKSGIEFLLEEGVLTQEEAVSIYDRSKKRLMGEEKAKLFSITP